MIYNILLVGPIVNECLQRFLSMTKAERCAMDRPGQLEPECSSLFSAVPTDKRIKEFYLTPYRIMLKNTPMSMGPNLRVQRKNQQDCRCEHRITHLSCMFGGGGIVLLMSDDVYRSKEYEPGSEGREQFMVAEALLYSQWSSNLMTWCGASDNWKAVDSKSLPQYGMHNACFQCFSICRDPSTTIILHSTRYVRDRNRRRKGKRTQ
jgi:hypothetical protein